MSRVYNEYFFNLPDMQPDTEKKIMYISRHPNFRYYGRQNTRIDLSKEDEAEILNFFSHVQGSRACGAKY